MSPPARPRPLTGAAAVLTVAALLVAGPVTAAHGEPLDPNARGPGRYLVEWDVHRSVQSDKGHLKEGQSREWRLTVDEWNVTHVTVDVTWGGDGALGASEWSRFELHVLDPDDNPAPQSPEDARDGRVRVQSRELASVPEPYELDADSREDVEADAARFASEDGTGKWTIRVTHAEAGPGLSGGRDYEVTITLHYYEAAVFRIVSVDPPSGMAGRVKDAAGDSSVWSWATGALASVALGLGVVILRHRRGGLR